MSDVTASRLELGFSVLAPSSVPAPFDGEPDVSASSGSYSLYWLISGSPPTFLQVAGEVGGSIPAYSKFDRNVQLLQNADVNGVPAYRDQTPIYDLVYWQVGDVVYSVESRNLTSEDSLSVANGLTALTPSSGDGGGGTDVSQTPIVSVPESVNGGDVVSLGIDGVDGATLSASSGVFPAVGGPEITGLSSSSVDWTAPVLDSETSVTFTLSDSVSGATLASATTTVAPGSAPTASQVSITCPESVASAGQATVSVSGTGYLVIDAQAGAFPANGANADFSSDANGGTTIAGTMPDGGGIDLLWDAPSVGTTADISLFVSDNGRSTPAQCSISVTAESTTGGDGASAGNDVTPPTDQTETSASGAAGIRGDGTTILDPNGVGLIDPIVQPTSAAVKKSKTPKPNQSDDGSGVVESAKSSGADGSRVGTSTSASTASEPAVKPTATIKPIPTLAPATGDDGMVSQVIGPEGGELAIPGGVTVTIPPGAFESPSTLTIRPVADAKLPVRDGVDLLSGTGFDITIASSDGRAMESLAKPAILTIILDAKQRRDGTRLYWINGSTLEGVGDVTLTDLGVSAPMSHFSRYVAGVPVAATVASGRDWFKLGLLGLAALFLVMMFAVIVGSRRRRRHRNVRPRATSLRTRG